jgi:hypothetical protein
MMLLMASLKISNNFFDLFLNPVSLFSCVNIIILIAAQLENEDRYPLVNITTTNCIAILICRKVLNFRMKMLCEEKT